LGSSGSLIPIITDQILAGGPVTVTDPDATRYFMLISEAAQLTLQAASVGRGGEVFVLDMGDPIPIQELVELLIYLHGNEAGKDIQIQHTGLGKAEKLHEELWLGTPGQMEGLDAITLDGFRSNVEYRPLRAAVDQLLEVARSGDAEQSVKQLNDLISAYGAPPVSEKLEVG
jgi:FlaA1/EpsC-like NDP-sugar epimerase